jgi:catechol 2,3-dioxygenase-like lactoylglutathione lyase family enzyme
MNRRALIAAAVASLAVAALARASPAPPPEEHDDAPFVTGLDHVPVAVADLEAAAERYRRLGFTLKPGRPHDNGIENRHVKFADGTEIELITAPAVRDALTTEYVHHLASGDGPAFLALYAPDLDRLAQRFDAAARTYSRGGWGLSFPDGDPMSYVFFGPRNASPTDLPAHFEHANGAESLFAVWLAVDDLSAERSLLELTGATFSEAEVRVPDVARATVARLAEGEVVLLPGSRQLVPGRRIVGATLRTKSLSATRDALTEGGLDVPATVSREDGTSIFLTPDLTHGIWLELREPRLPGGPALTDGQEGRTE